MSKTAINRQQEGMVIANIDGAIKRISELKYVVKSQNCNGGYDVCSTDLGWVCSCPDHKFRGVKCKHIFAVEISFALRKEVEVARIAPLTTTTTCIYCDSSNIVKDGLRHNKYGDIQKYDCRNCWKQGKDDLLVSKYYPSFTNLKAAITDYYRTKRFKLDITKYLMRESENLC